MSDMNVGNVNLNLDGDTVSKTINETTKAIPETTKAVDKVLSSVLNTATLFLSPFNYANLHANYVLEKTKQKLDAKLKNVLPEKIIEPQPYISVPTIQAICYSADCDELHDMFAALLATSMRQDTHELAHPSFVEIIKQLNPLEAKLLSCTALTNRPELPVCCVRLQQNPRVQIGAFPFPKPFNPSWEGKIILKRLMILDDFISHDIFQISAAIDNLFRLGILDFHDEFITDYHAYKKITENIEHIKDVLQIEKLEALRENYVHDYKFSLLPQAASITEFGKNFIRACVY